MRRLRQTSWSRIKGDNVVFTKDKENVCNGRSAGSVRKETKCSFRHDDDKRVKPTSSSARPEPSTSQDVTKSGENHKSWRSKSIWEIFSSVVPASSQRTCTNPSCKKWHSPEFLFYKTKEECKFRKKCSYAHRLVEEQPSKRSKKNDNKSTVGLHWRLHDGNSVVYFKTLSRRDLHWFYGRAQSLRQVSSRDQSSWYMQLKKQWTKIERNLRKFRRGIKNVTVHFASLMDPVIWRMLNHRRNIKNTKVLYSEKIWWKTIQTPIHRVTIISSTNDSCKSHGNHFKTIWMSRTSSWDSIYSHSS